ncbi:MAG: polymerase delta prime subunit [Chitinophagaceae bacterium]|nr:polymerase delta prime subunit [Chitinophagaceae bacterium]
MQFKDIINQQTIRTQLAELVQQNRLSHALLFLSKEGSGSLLLALAFAQYLTCEKVQRSLNPVSAGPSLFGEEEVPSSSLQLPDDSCGECPACHKAKQFIHPDIHFSFPVIPKKSGEKSISSNYISEWREFLSLYPYGNVFDWLQFINAENKQGNITSEECNDIIRQLNLKSFESGYKILIMWMPEYLGKEGNKLLKLIEEPPPNTLFILVAENEEQLLPTIISRCQLVKIPRLTSKDIEQALIQRNNTAPETAGRAAAIAEGNYREALQLLNHAEEDWQSLLRDWLNAALKGGPAVQVKWIDEVSKLGREKQKQFLRYFNHLLEMSIRLKVLGDEHISASDQDKDFANRLNKIASVSQQQVLIEELDRASYHIERNANGKMLFLALTIRLRHLIQDKALILTT